MGSKNCQPLALLLEGGHYRHLCPPADVTTSLRTGSRRRRCLELVRAPSGRARLACTVSLPVGRPPCIPLSVVPGVGESVAIAPHKSPTLHSLVSRARKSGSQSPRRTVKNHKPETARSSCAKQRASSSSSAKTGSKRKAKVLAVVPSGSKGHSCVTEASEGSGASRGCCKLPRGSEDLLFDARPEERPVGEDSLPWKCPACDVTLRASSDKQLSAKVWNH